MTYRPNAKFFSRTHSFGPTSRSCSIAIGYAFSLRSVIPLRLQILVCSSDENTRVFTGRTDVQVGCEKIDSIVFFTLRRYAAGAVFFSFFSENLYEEWGKVVFECSIYSISMANTSCLQIFRTVGNWDKTVCWPPTHPAIKCPPTHSWNRE